MTLEFEKLSGQVTDMARSARARSTNQNRLLDDIETALNHAAEDGSAVDRYVQFVNRNILQSNQYKPFRGAAFPLNEGEPLNRVIETDPAHLPSKATLIGVDGSQIVPDRHGAFVYYLINVGAIVYHHGSRHAPEIHGFPTLQFPEIDDLNVDAYSNTALISIERDEAEIGRLTELIRDQVAVGRPTLGVMDQRLLYLPLGVGDAAQGFKNDIVRGWIGRLEEVRRSGGWIVGYIDRPGRSSILTLLKGLGSDFNPDVPDDLGEWEGLADRQLFARVLPPGARSTLFVNLSHANQKYRNENQAQEMCFFFMNTGTGMGTQANIARIDVPRWLADQSAAIDQIHALLMHQCRQLGNYPYILARADEIAVVGKQDQATLEFRMAREMDKLGLTDSVAETTKQDAKGLARAGKQRHEV